MASCILNCSVCGMLDFLLFYIYKTIKNPILTCYLGEAMTSLDKNQEIAKIISNLLETMFKEYSMQKQLKDILRILGELSWLDIDFKAGIFLINKKNELILIASENFNERQKESCSRLNVGECYCGRAVEKEKIIYSCDESDCDILYEMDIGKKHYSLPLYEASKKLGVIVIYLSKDHIQKKWELSFMEVLSSILSSIISKRVLDERFKINQFKTEYYQRELLHKLVEASEFRDLETGKHIKRVTEYSVLLGKKLNLSTKDIELLRLAIPLHDVGKISISDSILLKPGKLTNQEYQEMKIHASIGGKLLSDTSSSYLNAAKEIALTHHEKWDGTGYPNGLKGEEIPLFGRICAIADVFDALSSERPYKKPWEMDKIIKFLKENSAKHFDSKILKLFLDSMDEVLQIRDLYRDGSFETDNILELKQFEHESDIFVSWDETLSIGVTLIDNEHKYLIKLMNDLYYSIHENSDITIVLKAIKSLREYTFIHFRDEEQYMLDNKYKKYKTHIKLHKYFEYRLEEFERDVMETPFLVGFEILDFLRDWLIDHILIADKEISF